MIEFQAVKLRRGNRVLVEDLTWTLFPKQHVGLTGANGCGKSSLFALILGELTPDSGDLLISNNLRISHLAQEITTTDQTARNFVIAGDQALCAAERALEKAQAEDDGIAIAKAYEVLHTMDAWSAPSRAAQLLIGLGFEDAQIDLPLNSFSGGWQMRLLLAQALMRPSDVLLLDEPTNHLDLDAVIWLGQWIKNYHGAVLMISHDRDFLDETVGYIANIENKKFTVCNGNYSDFEKLRAEKISLQKAAYKSQQQKVAKLQGFVTRFRSKASKARQAQSKLKALAKLEIVAAVQDPAVFNFKFLEPLACPYPLLQLEDVTLGYNKKPILTEVNFNLFPGDRVALIGPNGAGKSTLMQNLAGSLPPFCGSRQVGVGLKIGYFAQHNVDNLQDSSTPLELLTSISPMATDQERRSWLGNFCFSGDRVYETVSNFSGGEKSRLVLSLLVWQKPNLLLLDEPTNHLDMQMCDALTFALQEFKGAVVLVSHDRFLLRATADRLLLVANNKITEFSGDLAEYARWLQNHKLNKAKPVHNKKVNKKKLTSDIAELEKMMQKIKQEISSQEEQAAVYAVAGFAKRALLDESTVKISKLQEQLIKLEEKWFLAIENEEKGKEE